MIWFLTIWTVLSGLAMAWGFQQLGKPKTPRMYVVHQLIGLSFGSSGWMVGMYLNRDNMAFWFFAIVGGLAVTYHGWLAGEAIRMARQQERTKRD